MPKSYDWRTGHYRRLIFGVGVRLLRDARLANQARK